MSTKKKELLTELDKKIIRLAQAGDIKGFMEAVRQHPVHGRLIRTFALEEGAPEYAETMKRIQEKFGAPEVVPHGSHSNRHDG